MATALARVLARSVAWEPGTPRCNLGNARAARHGQVPWVASSASIEIIPVTSMIRT
jgi:hypothetical protein